MSDMDFDFIVIGAGMAGVSAAGELSRHGRTLLLEMEERLGYHSTGRSAAMLIDAYGVPEVSCLTQVARQFFAAPPAEWPEHALITLRGSLVVGDEKEAAELDRFAVHAVQIAPASRVVGNDEVRRLAPALRQDRAWTGVWDPLAADIDVDALLNGYLRGFKMRQGVLREKSEVLALEGHSGRWQVRAGSDKYVAPVVVNAAGAWAARIAQLAGLGTLGVTPLRRTAVLIEPEPGDEVRAWPLALHVGEQWYFKPESGKIMASCADETRTIPGDTQPEEWDIAVSVDRFEQATGRNVRRVTHRWAGLRTFAPDRKPVVGFAPDAEGFFWLAGQGGAGIMTAPALAQATAALVRGLPLPDLFAECGLRADALSPARFAGDVAL